MNKNTKIGRLQIIVSEMPRLWAFTQKKLRALYNERHATCQAEKFRKDSLNKYIQWMIAGGYIAKTGRGRYIRIGQWPKEPFKNKQAVKKVSLEELYKGQTYKDAENAK